MPSRIRGHSPGALGMKHEKPSAFAAKAKEQTNEIHYRLPLFGGECMVRAWRSDWFSDQFEMFTKDDWETFSVMAKALGFKLVDHTDED